MAGTIFGKSAKILFAPAQEMHHNFMVEAANCFTLDLTFL
jgi:hypothetical protein